MRVPSARDIDHTMRRLSLLLFVAGLLLVAGGYLLLTGSNSTGDVDTVEAALRPVTPAGSSIEEQTPIEPDTKPSATTIPANEDPGDRSTGEAAVADPIGLRVDKLGVDAPVVAYGVDGSGQMAVPDNVTEVGWYRFGPAPGEGGSAVLAAHVDLAGSGPGVFFELDTLEVGDRLSVIYADGTETGFRVIARTTYEKTELPLDVIFSREGPPVLTLITCGGAFNQSIKRYDSNVVVYAVPGQDAPASGGQSF
jgi:LPXTG-site transpeptidase (sortase) family protein